ncbi:MAG: hypothetical protein M0D54_10725 [Hyphomonadaceae bacterium JAD_PAG50586_4]|nr:MAG: hypothetical protein M0D54_10725 [Hyphomonadaceae bacterium JAD_PAG50586_4]
MAATDIDEFVVAPFNIKNFVAGNLTDRARARLIEIVNADDDTIVSQYLISTLLPSTSISTDLLSAKGQDALLRRFLHTPRYFASLSASPGSIASERFIHERVLPLARAATGVERRRLINLLKQAGDRHGRRYELELPPEPNATEA